MKIMEIIAEEAKRSGYTVEEIRGLSRRRHIASVRQYAMWRACEETERSLKEIGLVFRRDHTTVLHAFRKVYLQPESERGVYGPKPAYMVRHKRAPAPTYQGASCSRGHNGTRYATNRKCVTCARLRERKYYTCEKAHTLEAAE